MGFMNIQEILDNYKTSVYEQDVNRFLSAYASDIHIYDCWNEWECMGIERWKESVQEWFNGLKEESVVLHVHFNDVRVEEEESLAFVYCAVTFAAHDQGGEKLRQLTNRFTIGLQKVKDSWIIIHEHSSLPISSETNEGMFHLR
ncbi:YybH family protein [Peribacillus kribbensis]|uniref:YybH family protein n=1 Tax=Peribacillus kribbensis TaxID=356658 RepID=UPI00040FFA41|nr:nuclear transport factor 2 family protein [Peribacillus kribbensis]